MMSCSADRGLDSPDSGLPPSPSPSAWLLPGAAEKAGGVSPVSEDEGRVGDAAFWLYAIQAVYELLLGTRRRPQTAAEHFWFEMPVQSISCNLIWKTWHASRNLVFHAWKVSTNAYAFGLGIDLYRQEIATEAAAACLSHCAHCEPTLGKQTKYLGHWRLILHLEVSERTRA